ncbi:MAG: hypothetical protein LBT75_04890 [Bacilli bacterium]|jgi:GTP cyclohydrolase III|nr:hypothetical protein [Bacilli bacterium]
MKIINKRIGLVVLLFLLAGCRLFDQSTTEIINTIDNNSSYYFKIDKETIIKAYHTPKAFKEGSKEDALEKEKYLKDNKELMDKYIILRFNIDKDQIKAYYKISSILKEYELKDMNKAKLFNEEDDHKSIDFFINKDTLLCIHQNKSDHHLYSGAVFEVDKEVKKIK